MSPKKSAASEKPDALTAALSLARLGWYVFPVRMPDKRPLIQWHAGATIDAETIATWYTETYPGAAVGIHAGRSGLVIIDVDETPEKSGSANLVKAGLKVPRTLAYLTPRGGMHYVTRAPEGRLLTIAQGVPVEAVDIRAGNGYVVYYGQPLTEAPKLADAPGWSMIDAAPKVTDRNPDANEAKLRERLTPGKPSKDTRKLIRGVEFPNGAAHDPMLEVVTALVQLAQRGEPGVGLLFDETEARYVGDRPDRARDWSNAMAGSIKRIGLPPVTIPLTKTEKKTIAERNTPKALKEAKTKRVADFVEGKINSGDDELTDAALAERLERGLSATWANTPGTGLLRYNGIIWEKVDEALLVEAVRRELRKIRAEVTKRAILQGNKPLIQEAKALESRTHVVAISKFISGMLLGHAPILDADPDVLNCPNGVVDLRTGKLRKRRPEDYFTKVTGAEYHAGAESVDWKRALKAVPKGTRRWLQVRLGQAATGRISVDKSIPFLIGGGDNGKSAVVGSARSALGTYALTIPDSLLVGAEGSHPTDIMTLRGIRFAMFEELPRGARLNAQRIKQLAGTNELSGRFMRQDFVVFKATHTMLGNTNHLPLVTDVDDAIWARVAPVPFPYKYVNHEPKPGTNQRRGDPGLRDRLAENPSAAALAWLVAGAVASYKSMPDKPKEIEAALEDWRGEADPVLGFARDYLELADGYAIAATDLYSEFARYLESRGQPRWGDQLIASAFSGHSSLEGVVKRQVLYGKQLVQSRPVFVIPKATPTRAMSWVGVKFKSDTGHVPSEAETDAATLADLERRAKS